MKWLAGEISVGRARLSALEGFLVGETELSVAVEAAIEIASLHPDPIPFLIDIDTRPEMEWHGAAVGGLLYCGDRVAILPATAALAMRPPSLLRGLARLDASRPLSAQVEIWLGLAQRFAETHDRRLEAVSEALVRIAQRHRGEDVVSYRTLGLGRSGPRLVSECTFEHFASRVCARLQELPECVEVDRACAAWREI